MDSGAAWDSKQELAGRIEKVKNKLTLNFLEFPIEKSRKNVYKLLENCYFSRAALDTLAGRKFETPALKQQMTFPHELNAIP